MMGIIRLDQLILKLSALMTAIVEGTKTFANLQ